MYAYEYLASVLVSIKVEPVYGSIIHSHQANTSIDRTDGQIVDDINHELTDGVPVPSN